MTHFEPGAIFLHILLVLVLVLLNGFFVAAEFALVKVRQTRLTQLANEGNRRAHFALKVNHRLDTYLSATQLGITLASLALGWVGEPAISHLIVEPLLAKLGVADPTITQTISFVAAFSVITFLHIVLGELAPKTLAIQKAEAASLWLSGPLLLFYKVFMPAIWLLNAAANGFLKLFGLQPAAEYELAHTEEEIRILVSQSAQSGFIDKDEMKLMDNIFDFSDRLAREVMLPRIDMECLYTTHSIEQNMEIVFETKHTRYPVAVEDKDQIIGFIHISDLFITPPQSVEAMQALVRPILNVPESMEVSHVLRLMQKKRAQIALVVDEYGGTAGMLTTEEILEEIVGEIRDEFDEDERPNVETTDGIISVDGRMLLEDVNAMLGVTIEDDEVDSIGGWLFKQLEGNVAEGKKILIDDVWFEVAEVERLRIVRIHIYRQKGGQDPVA
ncbi:hemolysin family protein [Paenibacillus sp. GCM10027629]|uniref:hemolysin family protein n=1 Tax=Paenibacillus sp. GCM10027629 TaxID=3273414 RepID=UPI003625C3BB